MSSIPATQGLIWIRQGIALFLRSPTEFMSLILAYLMLFFSMLILPFIGSVIWALLIPGLCLGLMQACRHVEQGKPIWSKDLLQGLRAPGLRPQLRLGVVWLIGSMVAGIVVYLMLSSAGDGEPFKLADKQMRFNENISEMDVLLAFACATLAQMPFIMALWFAPALVGWHQMPAGKAVFYSFVSVWRAVRAFIIYGLAMLMLFFSLALIGQIISSMLAMLIGAQAAGMLMLIALMLLIFAIFYCSLYCCYESMFGSKSDWQANLAKPS